MAYITTTLHWFLFTSTVNWLYPLAGLPAASGLFGSHMYLLREPGKILKALIHGPYIIIAGNIRFWKTMFWQIWDPLPLGQKLAWIVFTTHTLVLISLIEILLLK